MIYADDIRGPWSDPDRPETARVTSIPAMSSAKTASAICFVSGGDRVRLTDDGLATDGPVSTFTIRGIIQRTGWWKAFAPEGPKLMRHGE